jgi:hypothetical protein
VTNRRWFTFKRPRAIRGWPNSALALAGILVVVLVAFAAVTFIARPSQWPSNLTDQWTALGALYGAGAFVLAAFAAVLATIAYVNSTEQPLLVLAHTSMPVGFQDWSFSLRLENRGPVAARFVAVRLKFIGTRIKLPYANYPMEPRWTSGRPGWDMGTEAFWEGGADAVLHPKWPYQLPLFRCNLDPWSKDAPAMLNVEVVADDVPSFVTHFKLERE